jgi:archaellum component FlaC
MEKLLKQMMEQMNRQFEKIDSRFDEVDKRFDEVDKRFNSVDQRFNSVDQRLDIVEGSIKSLQVTVENNASEFRSHFRHIENKLENHDKMFEMVSEELRGKNWS